MKKVDTEKEKAASPRDEGQTAPEEPRVFEEIVVEELSVDGICGVY